MAPRRLLIFMLFSLLVVLAVAPYFLLPAPASSASPPEALRALSREIGSGQLSEEATEARQRVTETVYAGRTWMVLAEDEECWGQDKARLAAQPRRLPARVCIKAAR